MTKTKSPSDRVFLDEFSLPTTSDEQEIIGMMERDKPMSQESEARCREWLDRRIARVREAHQKYPGPCGVSVAETPGARWETETARRKELGWHGKVRPKARRRKFKTKSKTPTTPTSELVRLHNAGHGYKAIAAIVGRNHSTVQRRLERASTSGHK